MCLWASLRRAYWMQGLYTLIVDQSMLDRLCSDMPPLSQGISIQFFACSDTMRLIQAIESSRTRRRDGKSSIETTFWWPVFSQLLYKSWQVSTPITPHQYQRKWQFESLIMYWSMAHHSHPGIQGCCFHMFLLIWSEAPLYTPRWNPSCKWIT